jgi:hypothetical protein
MSPFKRNVEVLDFLVGYKSYLCKRRISVSSRRYKPTEKHCHSLRWCRLSLAHFNLKQSTFSVFIYRFFTGLSLRLRADISKVTAHESIQHQHYFFLSFLPKSLKSSTISRILCTSFRLNPFALPASQRPRSVADLNELI